MNTANLSGHLAESLGHVFGHWEERRKACDQRPHVQAASLALAREAGTGGTAVAEEVGKRLGWPVYDHKLLELIAKDAGVRANLLESVDERRVSWLREAFEDLLGVPYVSESLYVQRLVKTVLALGAHGECVIVGRAAAFILPSESTFRVRLVAPPEDRVAILSRSLGIDKAKTAEQMHTLDRDSINFVKSHFQHDPEKPHHYDLLLNAARFSSVECAEVIFEGLRQWQNRAPNNGLASN